MHNCRTALVIGIVVFSMFATSTYALSFSDILTSISDFFGGNEYLITGYVVSDPPVALDADGNGVSDALTDGMLITRYLFGFSGDGLTDGAVGSDATRTTSDEIIAYLDCAKSLGTLDADGNGVSDALTDGILITRYLFGFTGDGLTDGVVGSGATRTTSDEIITFLNDATVDCDSTTTTSLTTTTVSTTISSTTTTTVSTTISSTTTTILEEAYFKFVYHLEQEDEFIFKLTNSSKIQEARDIINKVPTNKTRVGGTIVKSQASYNPDWSYHLEPDSIIFWEIAVEVCDASPVYIENHLDEVGGGFLPNNRWCPWRSKIIEEVKYTEPMTTVALSTSVALDADGNDISDALTDGILITRYLFGFTGDGLIDGAVGSGATRTTSDEIITYLDCAKSLGGLDADGNDISDALTDGILITRYLFGFTGDGLTDGAVGSGATRTMSDEIITFLNDAVVDCSGPTPTCSDGTLDLTCSITKPQYCNNGTLANDCSSCGCDTGYNCNATSNGCDIATTTTTTTIILDTNEKDMTKYSNKELFLISDKNWKDVLPFVSATVWTGSEACQKGYGTPDDVCVYPFLIYHDEGEMAVLDVSEDDFNVFVDANWMDISSFSNTLYLSSNTLNPYDTLTLRVVLENTADVQKHLNGLQLINYPSLLTGQTIIEINYEFAPGEIKEYEFNLTNTNPTNSFDIDSSIYFMQQYSPDKVTIIGNTPQELDDLLVAAPELGAGLISSQIQRTNPQDYLAYWQSYISVVYVEDTYELSLLASTYASLINAPLIIEGSTNDNSAVLSGRNLICVGNVSPTGSSCNETYNLEQLQQKYVDETNTDKIILVNPNDLNIKVTEEFQPEKSANPIYEIYSKTSLAAPILASAKKEILLSTTYTNYIVVDDFLETAITDLEINVRYLTIIASPDAIQNFGEWFISGYYANSSIDPYIYGSTDDDFFMELSVGRIYGLSLSDMSSYISRDIFYNYINEQDNSIIIYKGPDFPGFKYQAKTNEIILQNTNFDHQSVYTDEGDSFDVTDILDKNYINYLDHANVNGWVGISTSDLQNIWIKPNIMVSDGCLSCAFDKITWSAKKILWCTNILRRGALAHIGAVDVASPNMVSKIFLQNLVGNKDVGSAFKSFINLHVQYDVSVGFDFDSRTMFMLLGDPTFNPHIPNFDFSQNKHIDVNSNYAENNYSIILSYPERVPSIFYYQNGYNMSIFDPLFGQNLISSYTRRSISSNNIEWNKISSKIIIPIDFDITRINIKNSTVVLTQEDLVLIPTDMLDYDPCSPSAATYLNFNNCIGLKANFGGSWYNYLKLDFFSDSERNDYLHIEEFRDLEDSYFNNIPAYEYNITISLIEEDLT